MRICLSVAALALVLAGAPSRAWADEESHRAAAEDLLKATNTEKTMQAAIDSMLAVQLKANPRMEPFKDVMKKFLGKYVSYAAVKDELITLYTEEFTEDELKEIAAFYRTPTGKKAIAKLPALMQKGAELGLKRVQEHSGELKQMIEDEMKKQRENPPPR